MEETKIITLDTPIKLGSAEYDMFELREPVGDELDKALREATPVGVALSLISQIAKVPRAVAGKLPQRKITEASDFFAQFGEASPPTSET
jgi:hypothetical protein